MYSCTIAIYISSWWREIRAGPLVDVPNLPDKDTELLHEIKSSFYAEMIARVTLALAGSVTFRGLPIRTEAEECRPFSVFQFIHICEYFTAEKSMLS